MKDLGLSVTGPVCLVIAFCGLAAVLGADPWVMLTVAAVCLPIVGYVVFAIFTVWWAIKVGDVGVHQNMPFQSKFYFSHGMSVVLTIVLAAAGSFILFFVLNVRGMTSGAL